MADLNKIADKLKQQRRVGITQDGKLRETGNSDSTTLKPERFYVS